MTIRELVTAGFDLNCNVKIFDCTNGKPWEEQKESVFNGFASPFTDDESVLNMTISYITTDREGRLIIEGI